MNDKHTPTPWHGSDILDDDRYGIVDSNNNIIIGTSGSVRRKQDIKFIVRAVNSHEELLTAAKQAYETLCAGFIEVQFASQNRQITYAKDELERAIAKAEGEINV
jgi:hypothetical protein